MGKKSIENKSESDEKSSSVDTIDALEEPNCTRWCIRWLKCFEAFKVYSCLGFIGHELGCQIIGWLLLTLTIASIVADFFFVSFFLMYWQVVGVIINIALLRGIHIGRIEYFLPWLVKMAVADIILPPIMLWIFFLYKDGKSSEQAIAIAALAAGVPFFLICLYFYIVVMSLYVRYADPKDPMYEIARKKMRKQDEKNKDKKMHDIIV